MFHTGETAHFFSLESLRDGRSVWQKWCVERCDGKEGAEEVQQIV
jgi:hypothetical protein